MSMRELDMQDLEKMKTTIIIIGAVAGALVGAGAAFLLAQNAERQGRSPKISPGEGVKLGLLVLGLLRSVATLQE